MSGQKIKIPRVADKLLFECFCEVAKKYDVPTINGHALGSVSLGEISVTSEPTGPVKLLLSKSSAIFERLSFSVNTLHINFSRGGGDEPKSPVYDEITVTYTQNANSTISAEDRIEIVSFISGKLKAFDPKRQISKASEEQAQIEAIHLSTLERLEQLNEELIRKSSEFRKEVEEEYKEKVFSLETQIERRREVLDAEFQEKAEKLGKTKEELEKRIKEVDDRDNTHVRRELRKDLQTEIKSRQATFRLTKDTNNLRLPIHVLCIIIIGILFYITIVYSNQLFGLISKENAIPLTVMIIMISKSIGVTAGAIGFAIFYLKWMNRWLEQHTQAEFKLKQFQLDVDRASWAVETALAWKSEVKDVIPTVLLESITKNLFQHDIKPSETQLHPADQLASALLGTASKVRLKAGDSEIELDAKKLQKHNDKKDD